jgi:chromosome segregation protein
VIVKDLPTAFQLRAEQIAAQSQRWTTFATLDGETLTLDGCVSGGVEKGILRVKRQIKALAQDIASVNKAMAELDASIQTDKSALNAQKQQSGALDRKIADLKNDRDRAKLKLEQALSDESRLKKRLFYLTTESDDYERSISEAKQKLEQIQKDLETSTQDKATVTERMNEAQKQIDAGAQTLEASRQKTHETKLQQATLKERKNSLVREQENFENESEQIKKKLIRIEQQQGDTETHKQEKTISLQEKRLVVETIKTRVQLTKESHNQLKALLNQTRSGIDEGEKKIKAEERTLKALQKSLSESHLKQSEIQMKMSQMRDAMLNAYDEDIALNEPPPQAPTVDPNRIKTLKKEIEALGAVNAEALEEFRAIKERYRFLTEQQSDLTQSIQRLEDMLNRLNATVRAKLKEAFEALNEKFKEIFTRLFGNGAAEIILLEDDILEAGIEIIARPPGKKPRNLLALSGGEKALTAISLLFAGFMIKPTPLCILDEVDAALDEINTDRFSDMIKELSNETQFIMISHNKNTITAADYIYGVTMEEPGVSGVVSMTLAWPETNMANS